jgi:carbon starvation protein
MKRDRYAWVAIVPMTWLLISTTVAGWFKIFDENPAIGFLAQAYKYQAAIRAGELIAPAVSVGQMRQVMVNNFINAGLTAVFLAVVFSVLFYAVKAVRAARVQPLRTDRETAYVALQPQEASP